MFAASNFPSPGLDNYAPYRALVGKKPPHLLRDAARIWQDNNWYILNVEYMISLITIKQITTM